MAMLRPEPAVDTGRLEAFAGKVLGDTAGASAVLLSAMGDRLGLWKDLASRGPATAGELARRAGLTERYVREWLAAMNAAGYVELDPESGRFILPAEHAQVLAVEGGPAFLSGVHQELLGCMAVYDRVSDAFRQGGGVPIADYNADFFVGMERFTNTWFENHLLQTWIPAMPEVERRLVGGADVADVGCGGARGLVKLARAYPHSRFAGFDDSEAQVTRALANVAAEGLADRISVEVRDVGGTGLPHEYDVVFTFDVVHDAVDPLGLVRAIREALRPDGIYACLEVSSSPDPRDNVGPVATLLYGFSVLLCTTISLAHGGRGLGTMGLPEPAFHDLCRQAGFASVRTVPIDNPINSLYEARA